MIMDSPKILFFRGKLCGGDYVERRLSISEVAEQYQVSARTLRYYEEIGILKSYRKADSKYREYDREQCERLEVILLLRRLSFSVKMIVKLLCEDSADFSATLHEKIAESGKKLLEVREADRLLRDLAKEISRKPIIALKISDILSRYTYLTNKTERLIPMNSPQSEKYRVAIGLPIAVEVCSENVGGIIDKVKLLRSELEKEAAILPKIRIYDNADLPPNQVLIVWDGKEVWRKDFQSTDATVCADEIIAQLRLNCLNK
jgi:DNA-binding transcriptional MerR regulator